MLWCQGKRRLGKQEEGREEAMMYSLQQDSSFFLMKRTVIGLVADGLASIDYRELDRISCSSFKNKVK